MASETALVRIDRSIKRADRLESSLVDSRVHWALIHLESGDWNLNGYVAFGCADVKRVMRWDENKDYPDRALAYFQQRPVSHRGIDLHSTRALPESASDSFPLVTIHLEATDPPVCYLSRPASFTKRTLRLLEVDSGAAWKNEPTTWPLRDITRVDFGRHCEEALNTLGGGPEPLG